MSQGSTVLPTTGTVSGLTMTQDTNTALATLLSNNSGGSAPSSPTDCQLWADTTNNLLKQWDATNGVWQVIANLRQPFGGNSPPPACVRGLNAVNHAGATTTQFDIDSAWTTLYSATGQASVTINNPALITCNTATAGPAANGRDQSAAFAASNWLHFYYIYNPVTATLATICSLSATGPALPSGYTYYAYVCSVYWTVSSQLTPMCYRGCWGWFATEEQAASTTATTETAFSLATYCPPQALNVNLNFQSSMTTNASGNFDFNFVFRWLTGANYKVFSAGTAVNNATSGTQINQFAGELTMPIVGGQFLFLSSTIIGTSSTTIINVCGFSVPNGGE
jgi:hypothetical protein